MNTCVFSSCRTYRYSLVHVIDPLIGTRERLAMFIGLNPSKGDEAKLDPTLQIVRNLTIMHGCDHFVMTNLFAFCATEPKDMLRQLDPIGPENDKTLHRWAKKAAVIICCWGADGDHLRRDAKVTAALSKYELRCLALTSKGAPHHPLRLRRTNQLLPWRMVS